MTFRVDTRGIYGKSGRYAWNLWEIGSIRVESMGNRVDTCGNLWEIGSIHVQSMASWFDTCGIYGLLGLPVRKILCCRFTLRKASYYFHRLALVLTTKSNARLSSFMTLLVRYEVIEHVLDIAGVKVGFTSLQAVLHFCL